MIESEDIGPLPYSAYDDCYPEFNSKGEVA